ncbi:hypothetical protein DL95DRAFT_463444 [Leptodontidium sp. 2 PMI_412]|nr:hypothetical protein DL95DRAFT_463444 [Leptodontidium sp. 2 PMI_412]
MTDLSIWYSLLELSASGSKKTFRDSTAVDFNRMIHVSTRPFLSACEDCTLEVSEGTSPNFYRISISNILGVPDQFDWVIIRSWDDIRELNLQIAEYIPGGELWQSGTKRKQSNWIHVLPADTVPNSRVMGPLLAFALRVLLLLHGPKFLEISSSSKILAFFRPSGPFDGITLRKDEPSAFRLAMSRDPLRTINIGAFMPPRLFSLTTITLVTEYESPISICLLYHGFLRYSVLLCSPPNLEAGQSFDLYTVNNVVTGAYPSRAGYLSFSIGIYSSLLPSSSSSSRESRVARMCFIFSKKEEFVIWCEVLKLFQRLAPYAAESNI